MYCQACGAANPDEWELCHRCQQKLLVLSGTGLAPEEPLDDSAEEGVSLDEHLLERVSILEDALRRTAEAVQRLMVAFRKQEENLLLGDAGVAALRELLERKGVVGREEWAPVWESHGKHRLAALEKRERFGQLRHRMSALYRGRRRREFVRHLEDAEFAFFALDLERAVQHLERAFKLDRENYELGYFLGETHFGGGEPERALGYLQKVLELKPDHYEALVYSGVIYHELGTSSMAEELLKHAVALYPDHFLPLFSLGAVLAGQGHLARAVPYLERAVELDPAPQALYLLGSCHYEMGKPTLAIRFLKEAVRRDPGFEEAFHLLGLAFLDRRWNRKALDAFRQAQRLNPKKLRYHELVGHLSGDGDRPLPDVEGEAAEWLKQGEQALNDDRGPRALSCFRRALACEQDNPTLLMYYAVACLYSNREEEIEKVARRVLELDPGEMLRATAYATLIEALRAKGRFREGNSIGRELLAEGQTSFAKTIAYYEMAWNLAEMDEDLDRALDFAKRSLELAPDELRQFPLAALGWIHYKRRELDEAIDFLARSTELEPSATTLTHLGMALLDSGREEQARVVLAEARSLTTRGGGLEAKMMECVRDSAQLLSRVQRARALGSRKLAK